MSDVEDVDDDASYQRVSPLNSNAGNNGDDDVGDVDADVDIDVDSDVDDARLQDEQGWAAWLSGLPNSAATARFMVSVDEWVLKPFCQGLMFGVASHGARFLVARVFAPKHAAK
jgi:hypothetical protein